MADGLLQCSSGGGTAIIVITDNQTILVNKDITSAPSQQTQLVLHQHTDGASASEEVVISDHHAPTVNVVKSFYNTTNSDHVINDSVYHANLCTAPTQQQGALVVADPTILDISVMMPSSPNGAADEDCRKKRCVDRYDSSESSDSGVAILSCTDCSGSSTASSDITDPGSPYSTASSHSDDSGSQPPKMPPTQSAHHPPWPWTAASTGDTPEQTSLKRTSLIDKPAFHKRIKTNIIDTSTSETPTTTTTPICLNNNVTSTTNVIATTHNNTETSLINNLKQKQIIIETKMLQQGKITEYFKSQYKPTSLINNNNKKELTNILIKSVNNKLINLVENNSKKRNSQHNKVQIERLQHTKRRIAASVSVPRKILPAPSKLDNIIQQQYPPIITHTLIPHNLAYIQQQQQQQQKHKVDNLYTPLINMIQQPSLQKITTINNFNCVKLNTATQSRVIPLKLSMSAATATNQNAFISSLHNNKTKLEIISSSNQQYSPMLPTTATTNVSLTLSNNTPPQIIEPLRIEESLSASVGCLSSLEVNVLQPALVLLQPEQKSPILSQPKTIRFPAKERIEPKSKLRGNNDTALCLWDECIAQFDTNGALLDHLQVNHVISQASQEQYVCLWQGCKVHGRKSCSRSWLERHVLAHAGSKPYRCIVDGCGQRFNSQLSLERHVNGHFNTDNTQTSSAKKSVENGSVKLFRRNGKKIRFRRQPWSARMFDFIDCGIMEGLQYKLLSMTEKRTLGQFDATTNDGDQVTLQSEVIAKRLEPDGHTKMLLRWFPPDLVEDEWVLEKDYSRRKTISIPKLEAATKTLLKPILFPPPAASTSSSSSCSNSSNSSSNSSSTRQKHRRKPCKILTT